MTLTISAQPIAGPLWQRRSIKVTRASPGSLVTVRATTERAGTTWVSQATFLADDQGAVDLATDVPVAGSYRDANAMGLFWSQRRDTQLRPARASDQVAHLHTTLVAHHEAGTGDYPLEVAQHYSAANAPIPGMWQGAPPAEARCEVEQWIVAPDVTQYEVHEDGLVGTVFRPGGSGPFPTVIVLNGSGGGIALERAALYASRGIQAFALGYFRAPGRPDFISRTPLEYLEAGINFATRALHPVGGKPIVSGGSRGGELTLLLGARFPERIAGLVAIVPHAFVCGAQGAADPAEGWSGPTWTWDGEPLPHLWQHNSAVTWQPWTQAPPTPEDDVYVDAMRDRKLATAARIPIEHFRGPVACVSGQDDRAWPSSFASRLTLRTLERAGHDAERLLLDYQDAGHSINLPYVPSTEIERRHPISGVPFSSGGTPRGNAHASADSFMRICDFIVRAANNA